AEAVRPRRRARRVGAEPRRRRAHLARAGGRGPCRARARPRAGGGLRDPAARLLPRPLVVPGRLVPAPRRAPGAAGGDAPGRDGSARGVREGFPGLFVAATGAFYVFLRWAKVRERRAREGAA